MPAGPVGTDGIVIDARYFGKKSNTDKTFPYTEGKTLTHLLAAYLNVYELWSETVQCGDDFVDDTPIQNAPTLGAVDYRHVSTCDGNPVVMTMNFMDNSNDENQYMFTNGQKKRMHACLVERGIRYGLTQSVDIQCGNNTVQTLQGRSENPSLTAALPSKFGYRLYPNPAQESVNFEIATEETAKAELIIFNAQGSIQKQMTYLIHEGSQSFEVKCHDWSPGLYFARLKVNDDVRTEKLIIQK